MKITVEHTTRTDGEKVYPVTVTRHIGLHEVEIDGVMTLVESATYVEYPGNKGTSKTYTMPRKQKTPEEEAAFLARVREIATTALVNQGIW